MIEWRSRSHPAEMTPRERVLAVFDQLDTTTSAPGFRGLPVRAGRALPD